MMVPADGDPTADSDCPGHICRAFPLAHLSPPAAEQAIAAAKAMLGILLPGRLPERYGECNGFREDRGNAQYLFPLLGSDAGGGSLVGMSRFMWTEFQKPDLRPFVFFGSSSADETWGVRLDGPAEVIAYHHHMEDRYEVVGSDILEEWRADYARYEQFAVPAADIGEGWAAVLRLFDAWQEASDVRTSTCPGCRRLTTLT